MKSMYAVCVLVLVAAICACQLTGGEDRVPVPTAAESLVYAETVATAANQFAARAVRAGTITVAQARMIADTTDSVFRAVVAGRALLAVGNEAGALAKAYEVAELLVFLQRFNTEQVNRGIST